MKINFIIPGLGDSGGIRVVEKYTELFTQSGHDVVIYSPIWNNNLHRYKSSLKNFIHQIYCSLKTIPVCMKDSIVNHKWVWKVNGNSIRNADVTIATMWATAYDVAALPDKCGKKYYFIQDFEIWDNKEYGENSYKLPLEKIVISTWINEQLKKNLDLGPFPVVYNGLDAKYICDKELKKNNEEVICCMLNHKLTKKGVNVGLEAFRLAKEQCCNIRLIMFGMCDRGNLPEEVEYYQNPDFACLLRLYRKTDIFIFPSLEEGWGLTPIEAMANKCVIVGSKTGFILDIGENGKNMMISEPGNAHDLAIHIVDIANDVEMRNRVAEAGYACACKLNWIISEHKFENILNQNY